MELNSIRIQRFKKARNVNLELDRVNYLVGGNNSGKSSILQAIHCSVTAAQSQVANDGATVLAEDSLIYSPSSDFSLLGNGRPFENRSDGHRAKITFTGIADDGSDGAYSIELYKGRNNRNVGIERSGKVTGFGQQISSTISPFTVFVPGLAGVAHYEEFKTEAFVLRRIAGGEANLYLRNVLLILKERDQLDQLLTLLKEIYPNIAMIVQFDPRRDLYIDVRVKTDSRAIWAPIDLIGTGVLQAIQIFAYATLANPILLLLDEPDSHLHPSNQTLLSKAFEVLTERTGTKIILATHSRHLINSAPDDAKFFWIENGTVKDNDDSELIKLLMEIGILDDADSIISGSISLIVVTEDENPKPLKLLINSVTDRDFNIVRLKGVANSEIGKQIFEQILPHIQGTPKIIFHRDRDFMTDTEVINWKNSIESNNIKCFVTSGPDIESYYLDVDHLVSISNCERSDLENFISILISENESEIRSKFRKKRQEINMKLYRDGGAPVTDHLLDTTTPPQVQHVVGKFLVKKIRERSRDALGVQVEPIRSPSAGLAPDLAAIIGSLFDA
ncbi:MAG: ATP-dependent nuclease [Thalassobaculum sp.]